MILAKIPKYRINEGPLENILGNPLLFSDSPLEKVKKLQITYVLLGIILKTFLIFFQKVFK